MTPLPGSTEVTVTNVRPWGGPAADLHLADGRIAAFSPPAERPRPGSENVIDGDGALLLPAFCDVHVHLDSTRLGLPFRPHTAPGPTVWEQMLNDREHWREAEMGVADRATHTLGLEIARGVTRARTYAQIDADCALDRFDGVAAARETHRSRADVEIIAFPQAGVLIEAGVPDLLAAALRSGADVIGGIDPCALDADPVGQLDVVFGLAERHRVPVDFHLHEPGELGLFSLDLILRRTKALGMQGQVTISHGFCLGSGLPGVEPALERLADLDVAVTTVAPPRTPLPVLRMAELGIRLGLGQDGQRDYWSPYGNADMLDRTWQLAFTQGFRRDEQVEHAVVVATVGSVSVLEPGARRVVDGSDRPGLEVGDVADLLLLEGDTITSAVMDRSPRRTVLKRGRVVARDLELVGDETGAG